jgi:hypothetical protein
MANPGEMPQGDDATAPAIGGKEPEEQAGYMELDGAQKDADCSKVQVEGGVSSDLGCCNEFQPQQGAAEFKCGNCTFLQKAGATPDNDSAPDGAGNSQPVVSGQPS